MEYVDKIVEYFDELYPVLPEQKKFYEMLISKYGIPVKFLRIGCRTGAFEHQLAKAGHDVTGIDESNLLLDVAARRRRLPNMAVRFFQMSTLEMTRFLGKGFYNIISCLDDSIIFIHDKTLLRKFFYDCAALLSPNGVIVLQLQNYAAYPPQPVIKLPVRQSIRAKLFTSLQCAESGDCTFRQDLECSSGKIVSVAGNEPVMPFTVPDIEAAARESGFSSFEYFEDYTQKPFDPKESKTVLCCISQ